MVARNLLLVVTDQQRFDTMQCYGNGTIQTPGLNALSQSSFIFENAYCTTPICTPSRASFLTGQWPHQHQCIANNTPLATEIQTIAEMLDDRDHNGCDQSNSDEMVNRYHDANQRDRVEALTRRLRLWQVETGDTLDLAVRQP